MGRGSGLQAVGVALLGRRSWKVENQCRRQKHDKLIPLSRKLCQPRTSLRLTLKENIVSQYIFFNIDFYKTIVFWKTSWNIRNSEQFFL